jgi:hypothetical protein
MADDPTKTGAADRRQINVNQPYELRRWSKKLMVDRQRLREIVKEVGPRVSDVEAYLARMGDGSPEADETA